MLPISVIVYINNKWYHTEQVDVLPSQKQALRMYVLLIYYEYLMSVN